MCIYSKNIEIKKVPHNWRPRLCQVLMIDTSNHMEERREQQQDVGMPNVFHPFD